MRRAELPSRLQEITPSWLTEVLRASGAVRRARVEAVDFELLGTFSTEIWRLRVVYDREEPDAPASLIVKRTSASRPERENESFANEIRFYRDVADRTSVRTPRFHFGAPESEPGRAMLLLEDVTALEHFKFVPGASAEHARLALEELARLHADWWERVEELDWVPHMADETIRTSFARAYDRGWQASQEHIGNLIGRSFEAIGNALVGRVSETLAPLGSPATLLHGDAHGENLPLVKDRSGAHPVVFLDWAGVRRGLASFDVAVFIVMSLSVDVRRRTEESLVAVHADALRAAGVRGGPDPWGDYRRGVLRRAVRIVEISPSWPRNPAGRASLRMVAERCFTAAVDLQVGELIA